MHIFVATKKVTVMQDRRCKYKIRECKDFYLFIKHKESHIYYAKFPEYNKIASTGKTNIKQAYQEAYRIYSSLGIATTPFHELLLNTYKDSYYKTFNMAKKLSALLSDIKTLEQVTLPRLVKLQEQLTATGISGKSVNNYISLLRKLWRNKEYNPFQNLCPMEHTRTIRQCFPIESFKGYGNYISKHKYLLLPYIAISTGMRAGEFKTAQPVTVHNKLYLQINEQRQKMPFAVFLFLRKLQMRFWNIEKTVLQKLRGKSPFIWQAPL